MAISLVKDCLFFLSGQSDTNTALALQCLPRGPCETLRLGNVYSHSEPQETSRGKCSPSFSTPSPLPPLPLPLHGSFTGGEFGTRELEKGRRWVKEKHRWLSDGLARSDPDSPTQSLHLKSHFFFFVVLAKHLRSVWFSTFLTTSQKTSEEDTKSIWRKKIHIYLIKYSLNSKLALLSALSKWVPCSALTVGLHAVSYSNRPEQKKDYQ